MAEVSPLNIVLASIVSPLNIGLASIGASLEEIRFPPEGWLLIQSWGDGYALQKGSLRVIIDCEKKNDGNYWLHVSASKKDWTPSHDEMASIKKDFIGVRRYTYSVWAPETEHVNIHPHCLHLWCKIDADDSRVLPEFSAEVPGIGKSI